MSWNFTSSHSVSTRTKPKSRNSHAKCEKGFFACFWKDGGWPRWWDMRTFDNVMIILWVPATLGLCASFESVWLFPSIPWLPCPWFFQLVCSKVLSLPLPWQLSQGITRIFVTFPRAQVTPGSAHQWTPALFTSCLGQAAQSPPEHTGGAPCSQKSAICKKRFSNWEQHLIFKKLKNGSERSMSVAHWISVLRGCREALAGFSNIILRSCLQILTIPARVDSECSASSSGASSRHRSLLVNLPCFFYGKRAGNPRAWACNAAESTPHLVGRFVP